VLNYISNTIKYVLS